MPARMKAEQVSDNSEVQNAQNQKSVRVTRKSKRKDVNPEPVEDITTISKKTRTNAVDNKKSKETNVSAKLRESKRKKTDDEIVEKIEEKVTSKRKKTNVTKDIVEQNESKVTKSVSTRSTRSNRQINTEEKETVKENMVVKKNSKAKVKTSEERESSKKNNQIKETIDSVNNDVTNKKVKEPKQVKKTKKSFKVIEDVQDDKSDEENQLVIDEKVQKTSRSKVKKESVEHKKSPARRGRSKLNFNSEDETTNQNTNETIKKTKAQLKAKKPSNDKSKDNLNKEKNEAPKRKSKRKIAEEETNRIDEEEEVEEKDEKEKEDENEEKVNKIQEKKIKSFDEKVEIKTRGRVRKVASKKVLPFDTNEQPTKQVKRRKVVEDKNKESQSDNQVTKKISLKEIKKNKVEEDKIEDDKIKDQGIENKEIEHNEIEDKEIDKKEIEINKIEENELEKIDIIEEETSKIFETVSKDAEVINDVIEDIKSIIENTINEELNEDSFKDNILEIIEAKELENYVSDKDKTINTTKDSSTDDLKLTYDSINLINHVMDNDEVSFTAKKDTKKIDKSKKELTENIKKLKLPNIKKGKVLVFGEDVAGELGLGQIGLSKGKPVLLNLEEDIVLVKSFSQHTVCVTNKGELYSFGCNDECALGRTTSDKDDPEMYEATPYKVNLKKNIVVKASTGDSHTAVLTSIGDVFIWGSFRDSNGIIGLKTDILKPCLIPTEIFLDTMCIDIASGANFLLLLDSYGVVYSIGNGERGELGRLSENELKFNKTQRSKYLNPHPIKFNNDEDCKIDKIWCGEYTAFARSTDNKIYAWGLNNYCQLGFKNEKNDELIVLKPKEIITFTKLKCKIIKIASGQHHSLTLDDKGNVYSFGRHEYGRLGHGNIKKDIIQPKLIESLKNKKVLDISCGAVTSFCVTEDGQLYSWGMQCAQLGHGLNLEEDILEPRKVTSNLVNKSKILKISSGSQHCLVLANIEDKNNSNGISPSSNVNSSND